MNNPFSHVFPAYAEIQKLKKQFPNDQDLGREVRKYLDYVNSPKNHYSSVELDHIDEGGIVEIKRKSDIKSHMRYFVRDNKLYMTNDHTKILPGENYCFITEQDSPLHSYNVSKVIKNSSEIAIESTLEVKAKKDFTPEKIKQYIEKNEQKKSI